MRITKSFAGILVLSFFIGIACYVVWGLEGYFVSIPIAGVIGWLYARNANQ